MRNKTMDYRMLGTTLVVCHSMNHSPTQDEWSRYIADMRKWADSGLLKALLVYCPGKATPDARMRKQATQMWEELNFTVPMAIVMSSKIVMAVVTAINFFMERPMKTFGLHQKTEACAHVGLKGKWSMEAQLLIVSICRDLEEDPRAMDVRS